MVTPEDAPWDAMPPEATSVRADGMLELALAMPLLAAVPLLAADFSECRIPMLEQPANNRIAVHAKSLFMFFS